MLEDIQYSIRLSLLAYPPSLVAVLYEVLSISFQSQKRMLMECLNLSAKDILMDNCSMKRSRSLSNVINRPHQPAFYLIVDHKRKRIALSIRGTISIGDILTNLNCIWQCQRYKISGTTGYVIEGALRGALFVHKSAINTLINACKRFSEYQVVITGHSLGAAVAGILGMMYKDHPIIRGQNGQRLKVWCFGCPPVVSREFADSKVFDEYITTIALDTDVVTRISREGVRIYNLRQELINEYSIEKTEQILHRDEIQDGDEGAKFLRILKNLRSPNPEFQTLPLGRILWFVPRIVLNDDIVLRRKTLMKMMIERDENVDDNQHCEGTSTGQLSVDDHDDYDIIQSQKAVKSRFHRIRRRPMDQSSDDEDADDEAVADVPVDSRPHRSRATHLITPPCHHKMDSADVLIQELMKMLQDREVAAKCPLGPKALELQLSVTKSYDDDVEETEGTFEQTEAQTACYSTANNPMVTVEGSFDDEQKEGDHQGMYRIRKRPMLQSSDEEEEEEEDIDNAFYDETPYSPKLDDEEPMLDGITQSMKDVMSAVRKSLPLKRVEDSRKEELQQSGYVLCDATECRNIFTQFVFENESIDMHIVTPYMWACGATLKIGD